MKNVFLKCFMYSLLFISLIGCESESSGDVSQDQIYVAYGTLYDEAQDLTIVNVTFSFGNYNGTRLELAEGATVFFENREVPFLTGLGYYELKLPGFVEEGTFVYTDLNGNVFNNRISTRTIDFCPIRL